jgi:hypothetical protein
MIHILLLLALTGPVEFTDVSQGYLHFMYEPAEKGIFEHLNQVMPGQFDDIKQFMGIEYPDRIRIYICGTQACWDQVTRKGAPEWGVGLAYPSSNRIVLQSPRLANPTLPIDKVAAHELSHILLHQAANDAAIPRWFDEGIAMYMANQWSWNRTMTLLQAHIFNRVIPLRKLYGNFPRYGDPANLAYSQSMSVVRFMVSTYGEESIAELIQEMGRTQSFDEALMKTIGIDESQLELKWKDYLDRNYLPVMLIMDDRVLFMLMGVLFIVVLIVTWRRNREKMKELEAEDPDF